MLGYFAFLGVLIAVPFVGGTMDTFRISEFREKRQVELRMSVHRFTQASQTRLKTYCNRNEAFTVGDFFIFFRTSLMLLRVK